MKYEDHAKYLETFMAQIKSDVEFNAANIKEIVIILFELNETHYKHQLFT